jgi:putative thioredoxin
MSGAVDLSAVKARAEASRGPSGSPIAGTGEAGGPRSSSEFVVDVTEGNLQGRVERSSQVPVVFEFHSERSAASTDLSQTLAKLAGEGGGTWVQARVDVDAQPRVAQAVGVQSVPTVAVFADGQPVTAFQEAPPEGELRQWISSLLDQLRDRLPGIAEAERAAPGGEAGQPDEPEDPRFIGAEDSLAAGDYAAAEQAYEDILTAEPNNEQARLALAQTRFAGRTAELEPSVVMLAGDAPDDLDLQCQAADYQIGHQDVEGGFNRLVAAVRRGSGAERDQARDTLLGLFELFAADDERVAKARRNLASALF